MSGNDGIQDLDAEGADSITGGYSKKSKTADLGRAKDKSKSKMGKASPKTSFAPTSSEVQKQKAGAKAAKKY